MQHIAFNLPFFPDMNLFDEAMLIIERNARIDDIELLNVYETMKQYLRAYGLSDVQLGGLDRAIEFMKTGAGPLQLDSESDPRPQDKHAA